MTLAEILRIGVVRDGTPSRHRGLHGVRRLRPGLGFGAGIYRRWRPEPPIWGFGFGRRDGDAASQIDS